MAITLTVTKPTDFLDYVGAKIRTYGTLATAGTYATGGFTWATSDFGLSVVTRILVSPKSGYIFEVDYANLKILAYFGAASHAHDLLIKGGQAAASTAALAWYATDILGKEAVTDKTILGVDSATKGGVLSATATAGTEFTNGGTLTLTAVDWEAWGR